MPGPKGLFHRASVQSGAALRQLTPDQSAGLRAGLLEQLGTTRSNIDKLQELPAEEVVRAGVLAGIKRLAGSNPAPGTGSLSWGPTVDGKILPRHPFDPNGPAVSAGVPLLVGTVLNEFANSVQAGDPTLDDLPMEEIRKRLTAQRGAKADAILATFRKAHPKATPYELFSIISGTTARINALTQAERKAALGAAPAYNWWFHWQTPVLDGKARAFHTAELAFCFYNTDRCAGLTGGGPRPRTLAAKIADAWINFARNGDPNHAGLPKWPAFTAADCPTMIFNDVCVMRNNPDKAERDSLRA
jgi:para-nitrobenzyl esterase